MSSKEESVHEDLKIEMSIDIFGIDMDLLHSEDFDFDDLKHKKKSRTFKISRNVYEDVRLDSEDVNYELQTIASIYAYYSAKNAECRFCLMNLEDHISYVRAIAKTGAQKSLFRDPDIPNNKITDAMVNAVVDQYAIINDLNELRSQLKYVSDRLYGILKSLEIKSNAIMEMARNFRVEVQKTGVNFQKS